MPDVVIYLTGDQIGTYSSASTTGNNNGDNNGIKVKLEDVTALGSETDVFRVVVRQVNDGDPAFLNGQFVDIYAWPDSDPPAPPIYSSLNPQHDQFQGRASSSQHQIFTSPDNIVFDLGGVGSGTVTYGPSGRNYPREEQLPFESFPPDPPTAPCFAAGTLIETAAGARPVETLRPGDLVRTLDNGLQPVRWAGTRTVPGAGPLAPVRITAGTLGNDADLLVSQQHRILLRGWRAEMHFGQHEVLVAAKHLVNGKTIRLLPCHQITYAHLAFDRHEIIIAAGIHCESLFLGKMAINAMGPQARGELLAIFPELAARHWHSETARACLKSWETRLVV